MNDHPKHVTVTVPRTSGGWGDTMADEAAALLGARMILGLAPDDQMWHRYETTSLTLTITAYVEKPSLHVDQYTGMLVATTHAEEQQMVDDYRPDVYGFGHRVLLEVPYSGDHDIVIGDLVKGVTSAARQYHVYPTK